jgi:hypothetical protein
MSNLPADLKKILDTHFPFDTTSSRAIQRGIALYVGHTTPGGVIAATVLRETCHQALLFDFVPKGFEKNTFGANFTQNMKKDSAYFAGDKAGWKLTASGKDEAKHIFDEGKEPTKRRTPGEPKAPKPKAEKKAAPKPKAPKPKAEKKAAPKPKAPKPKAEKKAAPKAKAPKPKAVKAPKVKESNAPSDSAKRKAALRRKKRDLSATPAEQAPTSALTEQAPTIEPATASAE